MGYVHSDAKRHCSKAREILTFRHLTVNFQVSGEDFVYCCTIRITNS